MKELTSKHLTPLIDLFSPLEIHLAVTAALHGQPARLFADHATRPRSGLIWIQHRFYLAGAPDQAVFNRDLAQFLSQTVFPAHMESGFTFYYADPAWEDALTCEILPHHPPVPMACEYYELDTRPWSGGPVEAPEGFTLQPVSPELTGNRDLENLDDLLEELCSERPSVEDFLAHSFGACLLNERHIVTWVLSEYNQGERCEVGIATHPDYQRRGFAALTGRAFVEQARQAGIRRIGWHCRKNNTPSGRAALAIGFHKVQDLPTCLVIADPVVNLAVHGDVRFHQGDYAGAVEWFEQAFAAGASQRGKPGDAPGWAYLEAACASAMLGARQQAFNHLYQAVDRGFADPSHLASVECLKPLKETPEWASLIQKLSEQA